MISKGHIKYNERSLILLKPDALQRGLVGEIISRFEKKGLKIAAMKMVWPDEEMAKKHYDQPESAMRLLGERTIAAYKEHGIDDQRDPMDIARDIQKKLVKYVTTGPVIAMVIEGAHAIAHVRKIRGHTNPLAAEVGSITADYAVDSYFISDVDDRAIRNLVHASGSVEEAEVEIKLWFKENEIHDYNLAIDQILYSVEWEKTKEKLIGEKE
ncbi:nucleoside-diphosphate kinase [Candidatus Microgenomates bacterium]|nr:nucleoside-diphosphate kinase [Candidatus Microgenomates bacterium]